MIRAFGYLLGRSARNRFVRQVRRLRQPRYFVALVLGLAYLWFLVLRQSPRASEAGPLEARWIELIAALGVAGAIAWAWLFGSERRALAFTPAELTFLFPAPVTRRQLIHFKLLRNQLIILLNTAIWTFVLSRERFGASTWRHAAAVWVLLTTLSLHRLGASFVRSTLANHGLEGVRRKLLTLAVVILVLAGAALVVHDAYALVGAGWQAGVGPFVSSLGTAIETPVARVLLWPFHAMSGPLTAATASDWLTAMIPAVVLLALHYFWVLQSDAAFEEVAAQASLKRAQAVLDRSQISRRRRFVRRDPPPYPLTPVGSQAGAILWKNLVGVWRTGRPRAVALGLIVAGALLAVLSFRTGSTVAEVVGWFAAMWAGFLLVIGPQWIRSDLRSDMPSLDLLRSYPLPGRSVIAGEVAASTLVVSALQLGVLTVAYLAFLGNRVMEPGARAQNGGVGRRLRSSSRDQPARRSDPQRRCDSISRVARTRLGPAGGRRGARPEHAGDHRVPDTSRLRPGATRWRGRSRVLRPRALHRMAGRGGARRGTRAGRGRRRGTAHDRLDRPRVRPDRPRDRRDHLLARLGSSQPPSG